MKKQKKEEGDLSKLAKAFLDQNKASHFNYVEDKADYKISTGSLLFDAQIGGGIEAGLVRFTGSTESGKTSEALLIAKNFLETVPNSRVLYIKAEGRLKENIRKRAGMEFVTDPTEWKSGNCLVFECNIYDTVFEFLRKIWKSEDGTRFCVILDSMDGLISAADMEKRTDEANKVAAGALLTSDFLKRVNLGMAKKGHLCIMLSQLRAEIRASQYSPSDKNRMGNATGGNALAHYPDWIFEFLRPTGMQRIREGGEHDKTGKIIGHKVRVSIHKSANESTGTIVEYPVKYKMNDAQSVWRTREIIDLLISWGHFTKGGAWFSCDNELNDYIEKNGLDRFEEKIQGINNLYDLLEKDEKIYGILNKFCVEEILPNVFS